MVYGLSTGSSLALDWFLYPTISIRIDVIVGYTFVSSACDVGDWVQDAILQDMLLRVESPLHACVANNCTVTKKTK